MKTRKGYKVYPLSISQKYHLGYSKYCPSKALLNIGTSLTIELELNIDELKNAIYQAYERNDFMRIRFAYDKKEEEWYQYIVAKEERDIEVVDFRNDSMEHARDVMSEWTRTELPQEDSPMNRITIILLPNGFQGIYFLGEHRTLDAQSMIGVLADIITIYAAKVYDSPYEVHDPVSFIDQLKKDLQYPGSKAEARDRAFWEKYVTERGEPMFTWFDGRAKLEFFRKLENDPNLRAAPTAGANMEAVIDTYHLEQEPSERLMKFCEDEHVSLQVLLLMGMRTYFQKFNDTDDVTMMVAYARRATLMEKRCGGTRIHSFPFRTIISSDISFRDAIKEIRKEQNEIFRYVNFDPMECMALDEKFYHHKPGYGYAPISLTYQPASKSEGGLKELGNIRYATERFGNGYYAGGAYLTVMHRPEDNGLDFEFEHQIETVSTEALERFYYYLCRIMFRGIEDADRTIRDIIDWV